MGGNIVSRYAFLPPNPPSYDVEQDDGYFLRESGSGTLIAMLHVSRGRVVPEGTRVPEGYVCIFSHGNAEDLGVDLHHTREMSRALDCDVVAYDYTGYGPSAGFVKPTETKAFQDIATAFRYVVEELGVPEARVVLVGRSLGTGPTCFQAAASPDVGGVLLISPLLSAIRTQVSFSPRMVDIFLNYKHVPKIQAPLRIIHGDQDEVVVR